MFDMRDEVDIRQLRFETAGCAAEEEEKKEDCQRDREGGDWERDRHSETGLGNMHVLH